MTRDDHSPDAEDEPLGCPKGVFDFRVFDQSEIWIDKFEERHLLTEMSQDYLVNVADFLYLLTNLMVGLATADLESGMSEHELLAEHSNPYVEARYGHLDSDSRDAPDAVSAELLPEIWLEGTPLMREIRKLSGTAPITLSEYLSKLV